MPGIFLAGFRNNGKMAEKQSVKQMLSKDYLTGKLSDSVLLERLEVMCEVASINVIRNCLSFY